MLMSKDNLVTWRGQDLRPYEKSLLKSGEFNKLNVDRDLEARMFVGGH